MNKLKDESLNIRLNNINGALQIIAVNLVTSFAGLFVKRLNASDYLVSMLNSLPAAFSILGILLSTPLILSCKNKKKVTSLSYLITRSFYILMALVPFLPDGYRAAAFVLLYGAMNFSGSIATFFWQSFFADIFSPSKRSKVLSQRSSISTIIGTAVTLTAGILLHKLSNSKNQLIHYYQIVFIIAFVIGIFEVLSLYFHRDNKKGNFAEVKSENERINFKMLKSMLKEKPYMLYMICVIIFHFTWQMGWPLFLTYEVDYLHTNEMWAGIISTVNGICMTIGYIFWRKFSDKKGNAISLALSAFGAGLCPLFYSFSTHIIHVAYFTGIIGFAFSGVQLLLINSLYEVSPRENRTSYIALYNLCINLTLIVAPFIGMYIYRLTDIKTALLIVAGGRFFSSFLFLLRRNYVKSSLNLTCEKV
ncbi:Major Facilitator Superfamily protein [Caloramator quimbayensis]|uniref:Major Facilitator Superfamily protein n=1 Tax=Caloramator quimbayensis TaxID=1147123 RepID=A0A1T4WE00_9CLOT|nr:MFS transporter [Caloramator quimbayensis]SKA75534.1 Major Facilitator Superfamily protein [Caloramator quimbayensis]